MYSKPEHIVEATPAMGRKDDDEQEGRSFKTAVVTTLFTSLVTAFIAVIGWLVLEVVELKSSLSGNRFTLQDGLRLEKKLEDEHNKDSVELRADITDVSTDIDKRLSIMENDVQWIRALLGPATTAKTLSPPHIGLPPIPFPLPPAPAAPEAPDDDQLRKYDLRQSR